MPDAALFGAAREARLADETDLAGFRAAARALLAAGVAPADVHWRVAGEAAAELPLATALAEAGSDAAPVRVPPAFVALCADVILHREPRRLGLLYRLLWRLAHEPGLRHDALDADMAEAQRMAQAVRRDIHKMRAFVRFRQVPQPDGEMLHVAWFEPQHHIVERNAPFFSRRFTAMRWAILTPERCVEWDGAALRFGPGAERADAPAADAGEALWLTYYERIFNPARLKLRAMEKEMPRSYWRNLPEAALIAPLTARAHQRQAEMIEQQLVEPRRRIVPLKPLAPIATEPATSWHAVRDRAAGCRECPLGALATQTVFGEGPIGAELMLVGEQPGDREDLEGRPFVGPAGQLLARAMAALGWERGKVYMTNAVKHFKYEPRGKRRIHKTPAQREADACAHWLEDEIASVAPKRIVALGATAARQLLGRPVAVTRERGSWLARADGRQVLVTLHPSALLRGEPAELEAAFSAWLEDLRQAQPPA